MFIRFFYALYERIYYSKQLIIEKINYPTKITFNIFIDNKDLYTLYYIGGWCYHYKDFGGIKQFEKDKYNGFVFNSSGITSRFHFDEDYGLQIRDFNYEKYIDEVTEIANHMIPLKYYGNIYNF